MTLATESDLFAQGLMALGPNAAFLDSMPAGVERWNASEDLQPGYVVQAWSRASYVPGSSADWYLVFQGVRGSDFCVYQVFQGDLLSASGAPNRGVFTDALATLESAFVLP